MNEHISAWNLFVWNLFVRGNGNDFTQPWGQTVGIMSFSGIGSCADVPREACTGFYLEPRVWGGDSESNGGCESSGHCPPTQKTYQYFELSESGFEVFWDGFRVLVAVVSHTDSLLRSLNWLLAYSLYNSVVRILGGSWCVFGCLATFWFCTFTMLFCATGHVVRTLW